MVGGTDHLQSAGEVMSNNSSHPMSVELEKALARGWAMTTAKEKQPIRKGWSQENPLSLDELLKHSGNFALRTGDVSGVLVVDIDFKGGDAVEWPEDLPATVAVETGGGGLHLYFSMPQGVDIGNKVKLDGVIKSTKWSVDIRGNGGCVIYVGSVHPETGAIYKWMEGYSPDEVKLAELPQQWVERLTKKPEPPRPSSSNSLPVEGRSRYASRALERAVQNVATCPHGARNDTLNREAFAVAGLIDTGDLPESEVCARLEEAGIESGQHPAAVRATLKQAIPKGRAKPRAIPEPTSQGRPQRRATKGVEATNGAQAGEAAKVVVSSKEPMRYAEKFLEKNYQRDGVPTIRRFRQKYFVWRGVNYEPVNDEALQAEAGQFLDNSYHTTEKLPKRNASADEARPEKKATNTTFSRKEVLAAMHSLKGVFVDSDMVWLDGVEPYGAGPFIPFRNGLMDLDSRRLHPNTPSYFTRYGLSFPYDAAAGCPHWEKFLGDVLEPDSILLLQEWFGYVLSGDISRHKIFFLTGQPRSGKSTIAAILTELIGPENTVSPTLSSLCEGGFGLEPLIDKRLALFPEARLTKRKDATAIIERLLSISGGDRQTINRKYKLVFSCRLESRIMLIANTIPELGDSSGAYESRGLFVETTTSFLGKEDLFLKSRLHNELPGIANWAMDGYKRLLSNGRFSETSASKLTRRELSYESNPVRQFVDECCVTGAGYQIKTDEAYADFCQWQLNNALNVIDRNRFGKLIKECGFTWKARGQGGSDGRFYQGLRPRRQGELPPNEALWDEQAA
jgi:putative DNA primase/helicase